MAFKRIARRVGTKLHNFVINAYNLNLLSTSDKDFESLDVEYSEQLKPVIINALASIKPRNCRNAVDQEVAPKIRKIFMIRNAILLT